METEPTLPPGYEIRTLTPAHSRWANALIMHSTAFASPVWSEIYPENRTRLCHDLFRAGQYLVDHQIASGLSLGVFRTDYRPRRPESAAAGGGLYWDASGAGGGDDDDDDDDGAALLAQMDFPLVSVAMAHDGFRPLDPAGVAPLAEVMPLLKVRSEILQRREREREREGEGEGEGGRGTCAAAAAAAAVATGPGQVMFRNATATRADEAGRGFMRALAWRMMREAGRAGWRGIQISCLHDAVCRVWSRPPAPFRAEVVARFHCREDEDEEVRRLFGRSEQEVTKIYVTLR